MMDETQSAGSTDVRCVITLVHGTFATNAPWTTAASSLSQALRERLGDGVRIAPFQWSGRNSPAARRQAADELARRIAGDVQAHPGAQHFVIGHSHGGNVAMAAAVRSGVSERVGGVVCLATPFLLARDRDFGRDGLGFLAGLLVAPAFAGPPILDALMSSVAWPGSLRTVVKIAALLAIVGGLMLFMLAWQRIARQLKQDLACETLDADRVLIVRSPADEASGFLGLGSFVAQMTIRVVLAAQRTIRRLEASVKTWSRWKWRLAIVTAAAWVLSLLAYAHATSAGMPAWIRTAAAAGIGGSIGLLVVLVVLLFGDIGVQGLMVPLRVVVAAIAWPAILLLSLVLLLPFGWQVALANVLLDITAETTPPGSWRVHTIVPPTSRELDRDDVPLMHSVVYDNPLVLALVTEWIESACRAAAVGRARRGAE
jgi:pimeloyl-ACP methyl ester carboxylesterase